jgi:hypothetical protein
MKIPSIFSHSVPRVLTHEVGHALTSRAFSGVERSVGIDFEKNSRARFFPHLADSFDSSSGRILSHVPSNVTESNIINVAGWSLENLIRPIIGVPLLKGNDSAIDSDVSKIRQKFEHCLVAGSFEKFLQKLYTDVQDIFQQTLPEEKLVAMVEAVTQQTAKEFKDKGSPETLWLDDKTMWQNIRTHLGHENLETMQKELNALVANTDFIQR